MENYKKHKSDFKVYEIGDGYKTIEFPDKYSSYLEEDETLLLYNPANNIAWIRITVLSSINNDEGMANSMYDYVVKRGKKEGYSVVIKNDKSYFITEEVSEQSGERLILFTYEIGYKTSYIIISVSVLPENASTPDFKLLLSDVSNAISTIK